MLDSGLDRFRDNPELSAVAAGLAALIAIWIIFALWSRNNWLPSIIKGQDGRPSTSKFQFILWFVVVAVSLVAIWGARLSFGEQAFPDEIPPNVWIAIGLGGGTMIAAKGLTSSRASQGAGPAPAAASGDPTIGYSALLNDDTGFPDVGKIQIMFWTLFAVIVFGVSVADQVRDTQCVPVRPGSTARVCTFAEVPDIGDALMILMGLSSAVYVGKKVVTTDTPRLTKIAPSTGVPGEVITIEGRAFGVRQPGDGIAFDGALIPPDYIDAWTVDTITFEIPQDPPGPADPWPADRTRVVTVSVTVQGRNSANPMTLTVLPPPRVTGVRPGSTAPNQDVTIEGDYFGATRLAGDQVTLDSAPIDRIESWAMREIRFQIPENQHPDGTPWPAAGQARQVVIGVRHGGRTSRTTASFTVEGAEEESGNDG